MLKRGPVTPQDALREVRCMRLAARIDDLKRLGYPIHTEMMTKNGNRFAKYHLMKMENKDGISEKRN